MNKRYNLINALLITLILFTTISYLFYAIYSIKQGTSLFFNYMRYDLNVPIFFVFFRLVKEVILVFIILLMLPDIIRNKKTLKYSLLFLTILVYGLVLLILNSIFNWYILITGIRCYLYIYMILMYLILEKKYKLPIRGITYIISIGNILNFLFIVIQVITSIEFNFSLVGKGGYRYLGLYGGSNTLGVATLSFVIYFLIVYRIGLLKNKKIVILNLILALLSSIASGTRSAIISILIFTFIYLFEFIKVDDKKKKYIFTIMCILIVPLFIYLADKVAARGSILQAQLQGGRINIFLDIFKYSNLPTLIFGRGLGSGTNAYYIISNGKTQILDGTFTLILYQFGLVGIIGTLILLYKLCKYIFMKSKNKFINIAIILILLIQMVTANIFELYTFIIIYAICTFVLTNNIEGKEKCQQKVE